MSFVDQEDVIDINSRMLQKIIREIKGVELPLPFPRMSYEDAMNRYGTDKPDLRFEMELMDLSDIMENCGFKVFADTVKNGGQVKCIKVDGQAENYSRKDIGSLRILPKPTALKAWPG